MKKCLLYTIICFLSVTFYGCRSKTVVKRLANTSETNSSQKNVASKLDGIIYRLPQTVVRAGIPMKKKAESPGKFGDFAPCFFKAEEAAERVTEKSVKISIESPTFKTTGEPDPNQTFIVKTRGKYFENKTLLMEFSPSGTLVSGTTESKDETLDFALTAVKTVVGIGAKVAAFVGTGGLSVGVTVELKDPELIKLSECYLAGIEYRINLLKKQKEQLEKDKLLAAPEEKTAIDEKLAENKTETEKVEKVGFSQAEKIADLITVEARQGGDKFKKELLFINYQKAERASERLKALENIRDAFTQSPGDLNAEVYKLRLKEIDDEMTAIRADFFGSKEEKSWIGEFAFRPQESKNFQTMFVYSKTNGICINDAFGTNLVENLITVPKEFQFSKCRADDSKLTRVQLSAEKKIDDKDFIERVGKAVSATQSAGDSSGWYYRIPARATVSLTECSGTANFPCVPKSDDIYKMEEWSIAQLGVVVSMPAVTAGRSNSSSIVLDEATGALKNFKVSSSPALDKSMLETIDKTAQTIVDAKDPLGKKKRELELLKTQNEINEERKKLNNSNSSVSNEDNP